MISYQRNDPWEPPCRIEDLPHAQYLEIEAASSSSLHAILKQSPKHVRERADKPSSAKALGTVAHALILEPNGAGADILVKPEGISLATNAGKRALAEWIVESLGCGYPDVPALENGKARAEGKILDDMLALLNPQLAESGRIVCSAVEFEKASRMRDNILAKPIGRVLFEDDGRAEQSFFANDPSTGVLCKIRPDWMPLGHEVIVDLKTTVDPSWEKWVRHVQEYGYDLQCTLYPMIERVVQGNPAEKTFIWAIVESEPPYDVVFREPDKDRIRTGKARLNKALATWSLCEKLGKWPGLGWDWTTNQYVVEQVPPPGWVK